jgi:hypothetical protein
MERWNGGTVERWNGGTVERWNGGTVERSNGGTVVRLRWRPDATLQILTLRASNGTWISLDDVLQANANSRHSNG